MKRDLIIFFSIWGIFLLLPLLSELFYAIEEGDININPYDYARITDVDYKAVVRNDGCLDVKERLTFDVHAAFESQPFRELWRDLCEDTVDGLDVKYFIKSVKQLGNNGEDIIYNESPKLYWDDSDYTSKYYGPGKWYHSGGPYNESRRLYECVFFYVDMYREKPTFELEYTISNVALKYNDCSELYLSLYSEDSIKYLNSFNAQILFPNNIMPSEGNYSAYTYGTTSHRFPFTESDTQNAGYHTFAFNLNKTQLKFKPSNEFIEFSLVSYGDDKHAFTENAPDNLYSSDNVLSELKKEQLDYSTIPIKSVIFKSIIFVLCVIGAISIVRFAKKLEEKIKKEHNFYQPDVQVSYFREIPSNLDPNFAATLAFCRNKHTYNNDDGYSATLLSLARKGYIELERIHDDLSWTFNNIKIVIKQKPDSIFRLESTELDEPKKELEPLTLTENLYFKLILKYATGDKLSLNSLQNNVSTDYENTDAFVENVKNSITKTGITEGYLQKANYEQPKNTLKGWSIFLGIIGIIITIVCNVLSYQTYLDLAFGGFFILGIGFILSSLYLKKVANKYILLTAFGENEHAKWRGLYDFLNSETLMKERTVVELPLWEQYLVYATAFGISEKVIKALVIRCPEAMKSSSPILSNPYYRSRTFYTSSHTFRRSARSASHIARSGGYGSFSSGHGYGGGGRGGGGGRRRSLIKIIKVKLQKT